MLQHKVFALMTIFKQNSINTTYYCIGECSKAKVFRRMCPNKLGALAPERENRGFNIHLCGCARS